MKADMPRNGGGDGRGAIRTASEGPGTREALSGSQIAHCANCGHDASTHRGGRCWVDALGHPIYRTRSLIDCRCDRLEGDK